MSESVKQMIDRLSVWGALTLGFFFALAFCPTSAALFFGSVTASLSADSAVLLPLLYGVSTALPVLAFALLIAAGSKKLGQAFSSFSKAERWARLGTGGVVLACGAWLTLQALQAS